MKITRLGTSEFKGGTDVLSLSGLDIITGNNGSGKTRLLQAIQLGLSGAVPHPIEDRSIDLIELFTRDGEDNMSVSMDFEPSQNFIRGFSIAKSAGKDSVKQTIRVGEESLPTSIGDATIKNLVGDFPIMLNIHEFIRMSDAKRAELIFKFCPIDKEKTRHQILAINNSVFAKHKTEVMNPVCVWLDNNDGVGVAMVLKYLKEQESLLRKTIKENQAAGMGNVKSSATDGKSSLRHIEDITTDLTQTKSSWASLIQSIEQSKATTQAHSRLNAEKAQLTDQIEQKKKLVNPDAIVEMKAKIAVLEKDVDEADLDDKRIEESKERLRVLKFDWALAKDIVAQKRHLWSSTRYRLDFISGGKCPACGQATKDTMSEMGKDVVALENELGVAIKAQDLLSDEWKKEETVQSGLLAAHDEKVKMVNTLINEAHRLRNLVANAEGGLAYLMDMQKKLDELNHTKIDGEMVNLDEAELQKQGLEESMKNLTAELERKRDYDTKITQAKSMLLKAKQAEHDLEMVKELTDKTTNLRWEIVKEALEPIKKEASELFSVCGQKATFDFQFMDRRGNEVFKFGWMFAGEVYDSFVDFDSLSTAQQLFTIISLLAPLIHRGNPKLRLLMIDNVEVVDEVNRRGFLSLLIEAKRFHLDNLIVASSLPYGVYPSDITVHSL